MRCLFDRMLWRLDQVNSRKGSQSKVRDHYDLKRQFYALFLDKNWQYTMSYFAEGQNSLDQAQRDKKALIAAKLHLPPDARGMRVPDIGCGWGGLGLYLHRQFGCEVPSISLSADQIAFDQERAYAEGVAALAA